MINDVLALMEIQSEGMDQLMDGPLDLKSGWKVIKDDPYDNVHITYTSLDLILLLGIQYKEAVHWLLMC